MPVSDIPDKDLKVEDGFQEIPDTEEGFKCLDGQFIPSSYVNESWGCKDGSDKHGK